jgi:phosphopantetheinyl transferase (holo-ACP synthase)
MFRGPSWQGVAAIEQTGASGTVARLRVLPTRGYFRGVAEPRFVLDPAVLDAAGQVIGFWTIEHLDRGKVVFPFRLQALEIYGPAQPPGEALTCAASIRLVGDHQVRSDIDILDAGGRLWMRLIGWEDKRFDLPDALTPLILPARRADVSESWPEPIAHFPRPDAFECRLMRADFPSDRGFWKRVWMHRMLGRAERALFRERKAPESRQLQWLAGRAAAKEAVRRLLDIHYGLDLPLADIEILPDAWGRPRPEGAWRDLVEAPLSVSISHVDGLAVAVGGVAPALADELLLGIDVQSVRRPAPGFGQAALDGGEAEILQDLSPDSREEWMVRAWCAKEAVAKALGRGLVDGSRSVRLASVDVASETVFVSLGDRRMADFPGLTSSLLAVTTGRHGDLVMATTLCEPIGAEQVGDRAVSVLQ